MADNRSMIKCNCDDVNSNVTIFIKNVLGNYTYIAESLRCYTVIIVVLVTEEIMV